MSHAGFAFGTCREIEVDGTVVLASRISYVGELGWELHVPIEQGARLWDTLWEAGQPHGLVPAGIGVYGTTGRLEKGYRAFGAELTPDYTLGGGGHDPAQGQGAGVHRQGGVPAAAGRTAVRGAVHADRGLARLGGRVVAVHARRRADPPPVGRAPGGRQGAARRT